MKFTVGAVLDRTTPEGFQHDVYVVRDGDVVLYVGKSSRGAIRFREHLGWSTDGSFLGELIYANLPESRAWEIETRTKEECQCASAKKAETKLIHALRPCLNRTENLHPSPLPKGYRMPVALSYQNSPSDLITIKL